MPIHDQLSPDLCNCLALRQATRHVTQYYDGHLSPAGLRTTQFSILSKLARMKTATINAMADEMVMDRTTLGRTVQPLERDGLIEVRRGREDRRSRELHLTDAGKARLRQATSAWEQAQRGFEAAFGGERAASMRALLREAVATDLGPVADDATQQEA
jgi:DNA-binding MarR family transcriptional regulator